MTREEVLERTIKVIRDCIPDLGDITLNEGTVVNTDTGVDSMGFILIICRLEAIFEVKIPERQWKRLTTLGDVVDAIMKRLK